MNIWGPLAICAGSLLTIAMITTAGWDRPPIEAEQVGFRGVGMEQITNPRDRADDAPRHEVPEEPWPLELAAADEPTAGEIYENVQVLGHLGDDQFNRLMAAMTEWVSPEQGCNYCHNPENMADDNIYTKIVSRRMLQMTQHINANWQDHVGQVGVTCHTCHRGKPVPEQIWFSQAVEEQGILGDTAGQNRVATMVGTTSLPYDPFTPFFTSDPEDIRVISLNALPTDHESKIKQTEWTYGLMIHMSESLGVNCTYCHNSRSFFAWDQSRPQRTTAWHGIQMVRDLNQDYLTPLGPQYPNYRLGDDLGDAPKAHCGTCHLGVNQPLYGAEMLAAYPSLAEEAQ
ncbi:MAG: photosynthetic reaction center cytochrome PufC [Geminicoccaceae bacterium]